MNEICRHDYRSENASNDVSHFSVNIVEFEFQSIGFFYVGHFCSFCPKISSNVNFDAFIHENFVVLLKNGKRHLILCYKINTLANFIRLRSKLSSELCQRVGSINRKMAQNRLETCNFSFFFSFLSKTIIFKEKRETLFYFLL